MWTFVKRLLFVACLIFVVMFGYQNREPLSETTQFNFSLYGGSGEDSASEEGSQDPASEDVSRDGEPEKGLRFSTPEVPNMLLFLVFLFLGMLAAGVHNVYERMARRIDVRKRDKRIRELEKELTELRAKVHELKPPPPPPEPVPEPEGIQPEKLAPPPSVAAQDDVPTL